MKRNGISRTIKQNLFKAHSVLAKDDFYRLRKTIFPCEKSFKDFLDEQNYSQKIELAKEIIDRVLYEMCIPVPYAMPRDVLRHEVRLGAITEGGYASRDHFVHCVNLYLLGLYMFFCFKPFHKSIVDSFARLRKAAGIDVGSAVGDFVSAWKTFSFLHDVGYPLEMASTRIDDGERGGGNRRRDGFVDLAHINNLGEYYIKEVALRVVSRLILEHIMLQGYDGDKFENEVSVLTDGFLVHSSRQVDPVIVNAIDSVVQRFSDFTRVPLSLGPYSAKLIFSIISREEIVAVLRGKGGGVRAILFDDGGEWGCICRRSERLSKDDIASIVLRGDIGAEKKNSTIEYFVRNPQRVVDSLVRRLTVGSHDDFAVLCNYVVQRMPIQLQTFCSDEYLKVYSFEIYKILRDLSPESVAEGAFSPVNQRMRVLQAQKDAVSKIVAAICSGVCAKVKEVGVQEGWDSAPIADVPSAGGIDASRGAVEQGDDLPPVGDDEHDGGFSAETLGGVIERIASGAFAQQDEIVSAVFGRVSSGIMEDIARLKVACQALATVCDACRGVYSGGARESYDENSVLSAVEGLLDELGSVVQWDADLKASIAAYSPEFSSVDHGVASAVVGNALAKYSANLIRQLCGLDCERDGVGDCWIAKLAFGVGSGGFVRDFLYRSTTVHNVALHAICMHNLLPRSFSVSMASSYRVDLNVNPFAFLCIFCDEIQEWDRMRNANLAKFDLEREAYSNSYDINIVNNYIYISTQGYKLDAGKYKDKLTNAVDSKLRKASDLMKFSLSE